jgi:Domain of unknown function (DUF4126)
MDLVSTIASASGLAWASGLRLYAVVFLAGLLNRFGYVTLPGDLSVLSNTMVLGVSGFMFCVEFFADKIPGFDSLWDAVHTFVRIPAGALLAAGALGQADPALMVAAGLAGGALASGSHFTKAGSRALINTSPEPFTNWTASFSEDAMVLGGLYLAFTHPWVFLVLLAVFLLLAAWLVPKLWRGIKWVLAKVSPQAAARSS